jgi:phenylpropionate dioxygenase-like ring-hydroxylating dioxygenase large terminal subunit
MAIWEKTMRFLRNVWYAAAWAEQVGEQPIGRTIIEQPVALYRLANGTLVALVDVCPHRFAPLSEGKVIDDALECPYHGLRFGTNGSCVLNPHGPIAAKMNIRSYPVVERHGIVWIWLGRTTSPDQDAIPDLSFMDIVPGRKTVHNYHGTLDFRFDILIDNLLDLSHEDYLHRGNFSGGAGDPPELAVREECSMVVVERTARRMPQRPRYEYIGEHVDVKYVIRWWPNQVFAFERRYSNSDNPEGPSVTARFCHIGTPETEARTHYFHAVTREDRLDDLAVDENIAMISKDVIVGEDGSMLRAIDRRMLGAELMDLNPVILPTDVGGMRARAVMRRLLDYENDLEQ